MSLLIEKINNKANIYWFLLIIVSVATFFYLPANGLYILGVQIYADAIRLSSLLVSIVLSVVISIYSKNFAHSFLWALAVTVIGNWELTQIIMSIPFFILGKIFGGGFAP